MKSSTSTKTLGSRKSLASALFSMAAASKSSFTYKVSPGLTWKPPWGLRLMWSVLRAKALGGSVTSEDLSTWIWIWS